MCGLFSSCGVRASHCAGAGSGACRLQYLWLLGSRARTQQWQCTGPATPWHVGSSHTRDGTGVPCIARQTFNPWTTREAPSLGFLPSHLQEVFLAPLMYALIATPVSPSWRLLQLNTQLCVCVFPVLLECKTHRAQPVLARRSWAKQWKQKSQISHFSLLLYAPCRSAKTSAPPGHSGIQDSGGFNTCGCTIWHTEDPWRLQPGKGETGESCVSRDFVGSA